MKTNFHFLMSAALLLCLFVFGSITVIAQNDNILYGVTSTGGSYGAGVIFHIDCTTGLQTIDYSLPLLIDGKNPWAELTDGGNGKFYGMTIGGGANGMGTIFEWDPTTNTCTKKINFDGVGKGSSPHGSLTLNNGRLYGMTYEGGTKGMGILFEWDPATNIFIKKIDFDGTGSGSSPAGNLAVNGGKLYGMTSAGGANSAGVIFEWDPTGNTLTKKIDLDGTAKGSYPKGSLTLNGSKFYGMTYLGGAYGMGVVFEWDPASNTFTKKVDFDGTSKGSYPFGSLAYIGGKFYGMTYSGGTTNEGVIFEWDPASNTFAKKIDLSMNTKGSNPFGSLTLNGGKFYGMTSKGGASNLGVAFEWDPTSNTFTKKIDFDGTTKGSTPMGSLTLNNGKFYGMTFDGGASHNGVIFEWDPATTVFNKKIDFATASLGGTPRGSLALSNGRLYGMTSDGGTNGMGVIFEWDPVNKTYTKKIDFDGPAKGSTPMGYLTLNGGKFYGLTSGGGANGAGVIFEWDPSTNAFTKKIDFDVTTKGSNPLGSLILKNGKFYGMTNLGGANGLGVIFEWDPTANTLTKKIDFDGTVKGSYPYGCLTSSGDKFFGMTLRGGANGAGIIFEWDPVTNTFTKKIEFDGTAKGSAPMGFLTLSGGKFYGMTSGGGTSSMGVIFEWDPVTNTFTKKTDFNSILKGFAPYGSLTLAGGKFYGMTSAGGVNNLGITFEWDPSTNSFVNLFDFNGANGSFPCYTQFTIYASVPTIQATSVTYTNVQTSQMSVNWTDGNGSSRAVFIKQDNIGSATPASDITYTANTSFGSGTQIGTSGWYCIFNGTSHSTGVTVTNLSQNAIYRVMVCEYYGSVGSEQYNTLASTGNPLNQIASGNLFTINTSSNPSDGGITSGGGAYLAGAQASVSATPNIGWNFVNWTESGNALSTNASYSFAVNANRILVANFAVNTGMDENKSLIEIVPNPTSGMVKIRTPQFIENIVVYNSRGAIVANMDWKRTEGFIDLSHQSKGIYILRFTVDNKVTTRKIVVF